MSKDAMRAKFPTVAALVDQYRAWMADGGKVIYASENGYVIDRREPVDPDSVFQIPKDYAPMRELPKKESR